MSEKSGVCMRVYVHTCLCTQTVYLRYVREWKDEQVREAQFDEVFAVRVIINVVFF